AAASRAPRLKGGSGTLLGNAPLNARRCAARRTKKVATMAMRDGPRKLASHTPSGGMLLANTTRLAGFDIGRRKLAALAMNAQASRYGSGSVCAFRAAAYTAGVSTTAVASLERRAVTTIP